MLACVGLSRDLVHIRDCFQRLHEAHLWFEVEIAIKSAKLQVEIHQQCVLPGIDDHAVCKIGGNEAGAGAAFAVGNNDQITPSAGCLALGFVPDPSKAGDKVCCRHIFRKEVASACPHREPHRFRVVVRPADNQWQLVPRVVIGEKVQLALSVNRVEQQDIGRFISAVERVRVTVGGHADLDRIVPRISELC